MYELETQILLNRFRNAAELARLSEVGEQQKHATDHSGGRAESYKAELEEIERRVAETLEHHRLLWARKG